MSKLKLLDKNTSRANYLVRHTGEDILRMKDYIMGRVLTIIDASIPDKEQNKALKDVIRTAFHSEVFEQKEIKWGLIHFLEFYKLNYKRTSSDQAEAESHPINKNYYTNWDK